MFLGLIPSLSRAVPPKKSGQARPFVQIWLAQMKNAPQTHKTPVFRPFLKTLRQQHIGALPKGIPPDHSASATGQGQSHKPPLTKPKQPLQRISTAQLHMHPAHTHSHLCAHRRQLDRHTLNSHLFQRGVSFANAPRWILILRNRSYLRRFSACEFAQFVSICLSGNERCGHNSAAFEVLHWVICPGLNMGTDTEFGRPDSWPGGPVQAPVGRSKPPAAPRYGDRHGI